MAQTADGFPVEVNDEVWIRPNVIDSKIEPTSSIVGEVFERKIIYKQPDEQGYIGASLRAVFKEKQNAYWTEEDEKGRYWTKAENRK